MLANIFPIHHLKQWLHVVNHNLYDNELNTMKLVRHLACFCLKTTIQNHMTFEEALRKVCVFSGEQLSFSLPSIHFALLHVGLIETPNTSLTSRAEGRLMVNDN